MPTTSDRDNRTVATFDFDFTYRTQHEPIVSSCLSSARARARQLHLRWGWQRLGPSALRVIVGGNSRRTDLLCYRLERDLPLVAEGCHAPGLSRTDRQRLGRGFADMLVRGRHVDQDANMTLRGVTETRRRFPPYDYDCPAFPSLLARLIVTEDVIVAWNFNEIAPEVLLEELHTAAELVLEELVNRRSKRLSFAQLVAAACKSGALSDVGSGLSDTALLTQMKDLRKDVRHRGVSGAGEWLDLRWEDVAILLERLVDRLNRTNPD